MNLLKFKEFLAKYDDEGNPIPQSGDLVPWIDITNLLFNEEKSKPSHIMTGHYQGLAGRLKDEGKHDLARSASKVADAYNMSALSGSKSRRQEADKAAIEFRKLHKEEIYFFNEGVKRKKKQDPTPDAALTATSTMQITQGGGVNYTEGKIK
jgi:hypothetical protein